MTDQPLSPQPLPPELAAQLDQLRDIHLPPAVSWWPLAPGWWALAALALLAVVALVLALRHRRRTTRYRALGELRALQADTALGPLPLAERIDVLLKRILLQRPETRPLATAHGDGWIARLTEGPGAMPSPIARFIALAPYADATRLGEAPDRGALIAATEGWIRRNA